MGGGAAGGGKTEALLASALRFIHVPGYNALILMRATTDMKLPDAILDRAHQWLEGTGARWVGEESTFYIPGGGSLSFGYLKTPIERFRYKSAQFQYIAFDELTQFEEICYRYLFSRLRKPAGLPVPLRMRSATNPDGPHAEWVRQRFVPQEYIDADVATRFSKTWIRRGFDQNGAPSERYFVPWRLEDNPHVDMEAYLASLGNLDPVTYQQLRNGDWEIRHKGKMFQRKWFSVVDLKDVPVARLRLCWSWDLAHTSPDNPSAQYKGVEEPDYTVGTLYGFDPETGFRYVLAVHRFQKEPHDVDVEILRCARRTGKRVPIVIEQEPSSGKRTIAHFKRLLAGWEVIAAETKGKTKVQRAAPYSSVAGGYLVRIVRGDWNEDWLSEHAAFPHSGKKDQVDSASQAEAYVSGGLTRAFDVYFSNDHHLICHSDAILAFPGSRGPGYSWRPPERWNVARALYVDELGEQPSYAIYVTRPPEAYRDGMGRDAFVFGMKTFEPNLTPYDMMHLLEEYERPFKGLVQLTMLPPEAKKLQEALGYDYGAGCMLWDKDPKMGVPQLRDALRLDPTAPHPIYDGLIGRPKLYFIVATDAAGRPKQNDSGLLDLLRAIHLYHHADEKTRAEAPLEYPALRCLLAIASQWFVFASPKTRDEILDERLPEGLRRGAAPDLDGGDIFGWYVARQVALAEVEPEVDRDEGADIYFGGRRLIG